MNILLSVNNMGLGGVSTYVAHLANGLSARHQVILFDHYPYASDYQAVSYLSKAVTRENTMKHRGKDQLDWKINGVLKATGICPDYWERKKNKYLLKVLDQNKIDVIISFDKFSDKCVVEVAGKRYPILLSVHGSYDISDFISFPEKDIRTYEPVFRTVRGIVYKAACNIRILDRYRDLKNIRVIRRIFHGFTAAPPDEDPLKLRKSLGISEKSFVFGMIGRGVPEKGWKEAITAFLMLQKEGIYQTDFVVIGKSAYLDSLKEEFKREASVHFTGFVDNNINWINIFDVGVLPSYAPTENFTFSVVEYLFCGKPAIATRHGEIPAAMDNDGRPAGILVELIGGKPDISGLKNAMMSYLRDRELYTLHASFTKGAFRKFSSENAIRDYEEVIDKILIDK